MIPSCEFDLTKLNSDAAKDLTVDPSRHPHQAHHQSALAAATSTTDHHLENYEVRYKSIFQASHLLPRSDGQVEP